MLKLMPVYVVVPALLIFFSLYSGECTADAFEPGKAAFSLAIDSHAVPYRVFSFFALPGQKVKLTIPYGKDSTRFLVEASAGTVSASEERKWIWTAPKNHGTYHIRVKNEGTAESIELSGFVMLPRSKKKGEYLNGYRVGTYPVKNVGTAAVVVAPEGFVEVTKENESVKVSPHFTLGQFVCRQSGDYPKYLVLKPSLVLKLEAILEQVNQAGIYAPTLHVVSGYKTPFFYAGHPEEGGRSHMYGAAADVIVDVSPKDGIIDDLNKDGVLDYKDAEILFTLADAVSRERWYDKLLGGLFWRTRGNGRTAFLHVDIRGKRVRQ